MTVETAGVCASIRLMSLNPGFGFDDGGDSSAHM